MSILPFAHLHCHSHYSLLDGAGSIDRLIERAKALRMNALALTDHGNLFGTLEFYQKARAAGIKPVLGYEAYVAPGSRFHKDASSMKEASFHLTLLAQNHTGYQNLLKMASAALSKNSRNSRSDWARRVCERCASSDRSICRAMLVSSSSSSCRKAPALPGRHGPAKQMVTLPRSWAKTVSGRTRHSQPSW